MISTFTLSYRCYIYKLEPQTQFMHSDRPDKEKGFNFEVSDLNDMLQKVGIGEQ